MVRLYKALGGGWKYPEAAVTKPKNVTKETLKTKQ